MLSNMISSHVRISYRFYQFVTTRYTTDFYIIKYNSKPSWQTIIVGYFWALKENRNMKTYQVFLRSYSARISWLPRESTARWGLVWLLYQSRYLHSAPFEIVSLVLEWIRNTLMLELVEQNGGEGEHGSYPGTNLQ